MSIIIIINRNIKGNDIEYISRGGGTWKHYPLSLKGLWALFREIIMTSGRSRRS
ncbi:MAG TPA: hypothetical protein VNS88_12950 [Nitrospiraceae bacterium]|nr:hypothetical protein [Nitrospiraceae bacterium]